jgi:predicted HicB family RNase H-like nuclease
MCQEDNTKPEKPYSGRFNLRLDQALLREIAARAAVAKISLNDWVTEAIRKAL